MTRDCACAVLLAVSPEPTDCALVGADGVQYVKDVCLTLAAFLAALPAAAEPLLGPEAGLISAVAAAHDELAPQMHSALKRAAHVDKQTVSEVRIKLFLASGVHGYICSR